MVMETRSDRDSTSSSHYGVFVGYLYLVNYILGTGFLGIPYVIYNGGTLAGCLTLLTISFFSCMTSVWTLEIISRAQVIEKKNQTSDDEVVDQVRNYNSIQDVNSPLQKSPPNIVSYGRIDNRKFEFTELCQFFLGNRVKLVYMLVLFVYLGLACWSYTTVAASTWASNIPFANSSDATATLRQCTAKDFRDSVLPGPGGCRNSYRLCAGIFAVIVLILSCLDITEQKLIQVVMGLLRFVVILFMCFNSLTAIINNNNGKLEISENFVSRSTNFEGNNSSYSNLTFSEVNPLYFSFRNWLHAIPVFVYAQVLHQGIPLLIEPVTRKEHLRTMVIAVFATMYSLYTFLAIVVSYRFRNEISQISTLNWNDFTGPDNPISMRIMSYLVVLFPSLDVVSVYPMVAVTLGNNIFTVLYGGDTSIVTELRHPRLKRVGIRLVAAGLPIIGALFVESLVAVLKFAGLLGFLISYGFPIALQYRSRVSYKKAFKKLQYNRKRKDPEITPILTETISDDSLIQGDDDTRTDVTVYRPPWDTPYSTFLSGRKMILLTTIYTITVFSLTIVGIILPAKPGHVHHNVTATLI